MVKRPYIYLAFSLLLIIGFFAFWFSLNSWRPAWAYNPDTDTPLRGWAWTETIGWISFNNCNKLNPTDPGYYLGCNDRDGSIPYLVSADADGNLSGYAWSENVGWISFNAEDPNSCGADQKYHYSICPNTTNWSDCAAKVDRSSEPYRFTGWAHVCSLGSEYANDEHGWIKLSDLGNLEYKVTVPSPYDITNDTWGDLSGWAWNGYNVGNQYMETDKKVGRGLGWISFNSTDTSSQKRYYVTAQPAPFAITNLTVVDGDDSSSASIKWEEAYGATLYDVYRKSYICNNDISKPCNKNKPPVGCTCAVSTNGTLNGYDKLKENIIGPLEYSDTGLSLYSSYDYMILAKNLLGGKKATSWTYTTSPISALATFNITGICQAETGSTVDLRWKKPNISDLVDIEVSKYEFSYCLYNNGVIPTEDCWSESVNATPLNADDDYYNFRHNITDPDTVTKLRAGQMIIYRLRAIGNDKVCQGGPKDDVTCNDNSDCSKEEIDGETVVYDPGFKCGPSKSSWKSSNPLQVCPPDSNYKEVRPGSR